MAERLTPDSIDPFILAFAARLWTLAGLILAISGLATVFWTAGSTNWQVALIPLVIFLPASAACFRQRHRLLQGKVLPESVSARYQRTLPCELVRMLLWLAAIVVFLFWGLSGAWSVAWLTFVVAGLIEWILDRLMPGRGCP